VRRVLARGLRLQCPRCGAGAVFDGWFRMQTHCVACDLAFEREPGYFVGAIYVNYALTVAVVMPGYLALDAIFGASLLTQLACWVTFVLVFPVWAYRYSKSLWLAVDHLLDPHEGAGRREGGS
jgi:uncharacterized protein (DUF983 family)